MTKDTMIWQTLSMIIASKSVNNDIPETKEEFIETVVNDAASILDYSKDDIKKILLTTDCTEFTKILAEIYKTN